MPGRQSHGRPLLAGPKAQTGRKSSKARSQKNALNAFGIAQEIYPTKQRKTPRARELDAQIERKHERDDEGDDDEDDDEEGDGPQRKKLKQATRRQAEEAGVEYGSDSEGNEWQLGGMAADDDDSEIESDDAFGDSDGDKFEGYSFGGSKSKKAKDEGSDEDSDDSQDDEGETLGEEAIDLATALDQYESESDGPADAGPTQNDSEEDGSDGSSETDSEDDEASDFDEDYDDEEEEEADPERMNALNGLITTYAGEEDDDSKKAATKKPKVDLSDLGLSGLNDVHMKQSLKLMKKEAKEQRPGQSKKLDVPLARRQQAKLDRSAAYDKTNETLERWTDTVKQNRRAEHLVFPLPENADSYGVDRTQIQPLTAANVGNELESTIMSIMEQSGLSMEPPKKEKAKVLDDDGNELSRKQIINQKRLERELHSRETKRAARIKKIKSKAYHRVHRKQRERDEVAAREGMEEAGEVDSEAEREAQDRRRALERVGQRHKDSKWAKMGNKTKRAVWDDDFRTGLNEMARKDEELRRRKEGKTMDSDDETSSSGSDSEDGDFRLRQQLDAVAGEDGTDANGGPHSKLMGLKFMQKAEAAKKKANDDLVKQIRRDLDGEEASSDEGDGEQKEVGVKSYGGGAGHGQSAPPAKSTASSQLPKTRGQGISDEDADGALTAAQLEASNSALSRANIASSSAPASSGTAGAWSQGPSRRKSKSSSSTRAPELDLDANLLLASTPSSRPSTTTNTRASSDHLEKDKGLNGADNEREEEDDEADHHHHPLSIRDTDLVSRAFASDDVYTPFEEEKNATAAADAPQTIDNTLPGWGSWVGSGLSTRQQARDSHRKRRYLTTTAGVKNPQERRDRGLEKVIINEKRVKKNDRFLASGLPHPFESREQYERSLRLPVGKEWMTKEVVQDGTKPRVLMKQGIITPMSRPS